MATETLALFKHLEFGFLYEFDVFAPSERGEHKTIIHQSCSERFSTLLQKHTPLTIFLAVEACIAKHCLELVDLLTLIEFFDGRVKRFTVVPDAGLHRDGDRQLTRRIHDEIDLVDVE